ncbi:MAG: (2Fe-2S)-binding protein [Rhodospirillales bacterium]|jgi:aerobic carbon-monoxide dehydrogenase small subunit|nr:(2Fe-2S)-binding protein [Rhodospirillales bacterium]MBT4040627.1 (2Fe-2S)-binding protein [Rhodospirillales bacterium]MBT4628140.1 (2Fe-2S)-binding protein [Rhodospirillales bacterium]MBT5353105.1 (2Fe-2S)-binding protein [Rhodospirillales bacterium]MBT5520792.1 (2Fe-2S)-binding protein [Rhodospirillales bacterium]
MSTDKIITLKVNGSAVKFIAPAHRTLLEALRHEGFVEIKCGCEKGDCGACAVLLDGEPVDSCLTLAWHADGHEVTTIKGLGSPENPDPLQKAFIETGGAQCGYCTPGMIIAAKALLKENPEPSLEDIKRGLSGNLCRCTGYTRIFEAVQVAAEELRREGDVA